MYFFLCLDKRRKIKIKYYLHKFIAPDAAVQLQAAHLGNARTEEAMLSWHHWNTVDSVSVVGKAGEF